MEENKIDMYCQKNTVWEMCNITHLAHLFFLFNYILKTRMGCFRQWYNDNQPILPQQNAPVKVGGQLHLPKWWSNTPPLLHLSQGASSCQYNVKLQNDAHSSWFVGPIGQHIFLILFWVELLHLQDQSIHTS